MAECAPLADNSSDNGASQTKPPKPVSALRAMAGVVRMATVELVICVVWAVLEVLNVILLVPQFLLDLAYAAMTRSEERQKRVVIVGASFGGLAAQRELSGRSDLKVSLIDYKSYFEYTPGILRCFVQPTFLKQLTCPLPASRNELIRGAMTGATQKAVTLRDEQGAEQHVPFDYLVLAVGSTYADPIKVAVGIEFTPV